MADRIEDLRAWWDRTRRRRLKPGVQTLATKLRPGETPGSGEDAAATPDAAVASAATAPTGPGPSAMPDRPDWPAPDLVEAEPTSSPMSPERSSAPWPAEDLPPGTGEATERPGSEPAASDGTIAEPMVGSADTGASEARTAETADLAARDVEGPGARDDSRAAPTDEGAPAELDASADVDAPADEAGSHAARAAASASDEPAADDAPPEPDGSVVPDTVSRGMPDVVETADERAAPTEADASGEAVPASVVADRPASDPWAGVTWSDEPAATADEPPDGDEPRGVDEPPAGHEPRGVDEPPAGHEPRGVDEPPAGHEPPAGDEPPTGDEPPADAPARGDEAATAAAATTPDGRLVLDEDQRRWLGRDVGLVESIGAGYGAQLAAIGVATLQDLLLQGATRRGRQEIADSTGISGKLILRWVNNADLFRIRGVGTQYADLLEAAGVDTVVELAGRRPVNLAARLATTNELRSLVKQVPSEAQVADWVEQAKGLPRIVAY